MVPTLRNVINRDRSPMPFRRTFDIQPATHSADVQHQISPTEMSKVEKDNYRKVGLGPQEVTCHFDAAHEPQVS